MNPTEEKIKQLQAQLDALKSELSKPSKLSAEQWLKNLLTEADFTVKVTDGFITYSRAGQWIFQQDLKNRVLWCYYYKVWEIFEEIYGMEYEQIQALHKDLVCKALNCEEFTPP